MTVQRSRPSVHAHEGIEAFKTTVTYELEDRVRARQRLIEHAKLVYAPIKAVINADPQAKSALTALGPLVEEERLKLKSVRSALTGIDMKMLSLTTQGGLTVGVP